VNIHQWTAAPTGMSAPTKYKQQEVDHTLKSAVIKSWSIITYGAAISEINLETN